VGALLLQISQPVHKWHPAQEIATLSPCSTKSSMVCDNPEPVKSKLGSVIILPCVTLAQMS
jgi:hypothetical protein